MASTDVLRDGIVIGSVAGTNFFDDTRESDTRYRYELVAVGGNGLRSDAVNVPSSETFVVDGENLNTVLNEIARVVTGNVFSGTFPEALQLAALSGGLNLSTTSTVDTPQAFITNFECGRGGTAVESRAKSGGRFTVSVTLDACIGPQKTISGNAENSNGVSGSQLTLRSLSITSNDDGNETTISGKFESVDVVSGLRILEVGSYQEINFDGTRRPVTNYRTLTRINLSGDFSDTDPVERLTSEWTSSGLFSNDVSITADTPVQFERLDGEPELSVGTLVVTADNGAELTINAGNGDPLSFSVTVLNGENTEVFTTQLSADNRYGLAVDVF